MAIVIYARKSTNRDDRQVQSIDGQIRVLKEIAQREGLQIQEIIVESESASTPGIRPKFAELMKRIDDGEVRGIFVWAVHRLARNELEHGWIAYMLRIGKLQFVRSSERYYRPEDNALFLAIENGMAVQYVSDLRKNVSWGMQNKALRGWHTSKPPVGYYHDRNLLEVVPDPERFGVIRKCFEMILSGHHSVSDVYRYLAAIEFRIRVENGRASIISQSHVYGILKNRFYMGEVPYNGEWLAGKHLPIVTAEEFYSVQLRTRRHTKKNKSVLRGFALGNALRCKKCGCTIIGDRRVKRYKQRTATYIYYRCTGSRGCSKSGVREEVLCEEVIKQLRLFAIPPDLSKWIMYSMNQVALSELKNSATDPDELRRMIAREEKRLATVTEMRLDGEIQPEEYGEHRQSILSRIAGLREKTAISLNEREIVARLVQERLDAAVAADELKHEDEPAEVLGNILRIAGDCLLNLVPFEFHLDPILEKIATFKPRLLKSGSAIHDGVVTPFSIWWTLAEELRTIATDQLSRNDCTRVAGGGFPRLKGLEEKKRQRKRVKTGQLMVDWIKRQDNE